MVMIEVSESKIGKMAEYAEKMLRYGGKLMSCIDTIERGEYGDREGYREDGSSYGSRYGMRSRYDSYGQRDDYGMRGGMGGYRDDEDWEEEEMGERRGRRRRDSRGRYM